MASSSFSLKRYLVLFSVYVASKFKNFDAFAYLLSILCLALVTGCTKKDAGPITPAEQGKKVYVSYCLSCHSVDPKKDGALGPAIWGSSKELLSARVLKAQYPAGYKPKRDTKIMTTFPLSDKQITALQVYLNQ